MKGNTSIRHLPTSSIENGQIIKELPLVPYGDSRIPIFSVINPATCIKCGCSLRANSNYTRTIISSYDALSIPIQYWVCDKCNKSHPDQILGVTGGNNYSDEYKEKIHATRNIGKCSLSCTRAVGHIFTQDTKHMGKSPCTTTIWKYEQEQGELSLTQLKETEVELNGKIFVDGLYIKTGWKKNLEKLINKSISNRQWKRMRYKVLYVIATEEKVILDFEIANPQPSFLELIPLFSRVKERFGKRNVRTIVSDEEWAIIYAAQHVFPDADMSFCVFHQLQKIDKKYFDVYKDKAHIPTIDLKFYDLFKKVILSENVIESSAHISTIEGLMKTEKVSEVVLKTHKYVREKYLSNRRLFEKHMTPETNNTMEQIFSTLKDFVIQCRSFKNVNGLKNWAANLFLHKNSSPFKTGNYRGMSPLEINTSKSGACG